MTTHGANTSETPSPVEGEGGGGASVRRAAETHNHQMTDVSPDIARTVGSAVGRVTGHWPGGTDWDVLGCIDCGFAEVRFHSGIKLRASVKVRGWNLPAGRITPEESAAQAASAEPTSDQ